MIRTTIMLPADLKTRAEQRARQRGTSLAELIRQALEMELEGSVGTDPLFADDAPFSGEAPSDLAERHDHYLYDLDR